MNRHSAPGSKQRGPIDFRDHVVVAGRMVYVQIQHVDDSVWLATGLVSEPLPSGPQLRSPVEVSATGHTGELALDALKRKVTEFDYDTGD